MWKFRNDPIQNLSVSVCMCVCLSVLNLILDHWRDRNKTFRGRRHQPLDGYYILITYFYYVHFKIIYEKPVTRLILIARIHTYLVQETPRTTSYIPFYLLLTSYLLPPFLPPTSLPTSLSTSYLPFYLLPPFLSPTSYLPFYLLPTSYLPLYLLHPSSLFTSYLPFYLLPPFLPLTSLSTSYLPSISLSTSYLPFYLLFPSYFVPPLLPPTSLCTSSFYLSPFEKSVISLISPHHRHSRDG